MVHLYTEKYTHLNECYYGKHPLVILIFVFSIDISVYSLDKGISIHQISPFPLKLSVSLSIWHETCAKLWSTYELPFPPTLLIWTKESYYVFGSSKEVKIIASMFNCLHCCIHYNAQQEFQLQLTLIDNVIEFFIKTQYIALCSFRLNRQHLIYT